MDIKKAKGYETAPALIAEYEKVSLRVVDAKHRYEEAERELTRATRGLAEALIPEGSIDGQSYRIWVPHGLLELTAHPTWGAKCAVAWIVKDESREPVGVAVESA